MLATGGFSALSFSSSSGLILEVDVQDDLSVIDQIEGAVFGFSVFVGETIKASDQAQTAGTLTAVVDAEVSAVDELIAAAEVTALIAEAAQFGAIRQISGGFFSDAFASGAFSALGDETRKLAGDTTVTSFIGTVSMFESVQVIDTLIDNVILPILVVDAVEIVDVSGVFFTVNRSVSETTISEDNIGALVDFDVRLIEEVATSSVASPSAVLNVPVEDNMLVIDTLSSQFIANTVVINNAITSDFYRVQVNFATQVFEDVIALDVITVRKQWEPINTFEALDWVTINTAKPV